LNYQFSEGSFTTKVLKDTSVFLQANPRMKFKREIEALKDVIISQKKRIDTYKKKEKLHGDDMGGRDELIMSLQEENQELTREKFYLKEVIQQKDRKQGEAERQISEMDKRIQDLEE